MKILLTNQNLNLKNHSFYDFLQEPKTCIPSVISKNSIIYYLTLLLEYPEVYPTSPPLNFLFCHNCILIMAYLVFATIQIFI